MKRSGPGSTFRLYLDLNGGGTYTNMTTAIRERVRRRVALAGGREAHLPELPVCLSSLVILILYR